MTGYMSMLMRLCMSLLSKYTSMTRYHCAWDVWSTSQKTEPEFRLIDVGNLYVLDFIYKSAIIDQFCPIYKLP